MTLEARIINFKKAIRQGKSKSIVKFKYLEYMKEYDELAGEQTVGDKVRHKDLFNDYCRYMKGEK